MKFQVTRGMLIQELLELEIRMRVPRGTLTLFKYPGRGGWVVSRGRELIIPRPQEARDMLSTLQFANEVLKESVWHA